MFGDTRAEKVAEHNFFFKRLE